MYQDTFDGLDMQTWNHPRIILPMVDKWFNGAWNNMAATCGITIDKVHAERTSPSRDV